MPKFQDKLIADGYCDDRGAGFCANATKLPNGEWGLVALCLIENILNLYDIDMKSNIGELLYTVDLKQITNLKISRGFLSQTLKFEYNGSKYAFKDIAGGKNILKIVEEEANNR